ncbi:riboflavin synthase [Kallipyga gabonensis]|uniref:riboflavin synthase n=1 Tax=Kallipyga gabonensis TaxID=1686287 RepID=UPI0006B62572|nr:riboflavin synthase [Kallipyga gabonensis]
MFTGIIEEIGRIKAIRRGRASAELEIAAKKVLEDVQVGDSIATNGICLTVTGFSPSSFRADVMHETLNRTAFQSLKVGSPVNLERAMVANGRFGGHMVSGHIDGTGKIMALEEDDNALWVTIGTSPDILRYIVEKGSIAIDGISLTVATVGADRFQVSLIPHSLKETNLQYKKKGAPVNLECDMVAKYVDKFLSKVAGEGGGEGGSGLTREFLLRNGF